MGLDELLLQASDPHSACGHGSPVESGRAGGHIPIISAGETRFKWCKSLFSKTTLLGFHSAVLAVSTNLNHQINDHNDIE
jgi:hypothetical protein